MINFITKVKNDKKEYKNQLARAATLPDDYRFVFDKIQSYMWSQSAADGSDMLKAQGQLIELFESSAAEGKQVLQLTGEDVAGFLDDFLRDTKKWTDTYSKRLNRQVQNKLSKQNNLK